VDVKVSVIGSGYVGTTHAACLADLGHEVVAIDIDEDVVDAIRAGRAPLHEPGLADLVAEHAGGRLRATTDYDAVLETDVTFVCVQTPSADDGGQDLAAYEAVAQSLGETLAGKEGKHVVVTKSTVLPGTNDEVLAPVLERESGKTLGADLGVAMNPEFLREGSAVADFHSPDKIVVGAADADTRRTVLDLYADLIAEADPAIVETGLREAELIKYANNAFLASKVSLVNDLANVCKELDVDAYDVLEAVGLDDRIGSAFMRAGLGWGGSCFPKDVAALRWLAREHDYDPPMLDAAFEVNDLQPTRLVDLLADHVAVDGARVGVLGLAFKPGTDDVRNSRSLDVIAELHERGADVVTYDPEAMANVRERLPELDYADSAEGALAGADAALLCTAWEEFHDLDYSGMNRSVVVDGRRMRVDREAVEVYEGLCW
jgi:UDPglucose 6-dehydrogenase